MPEWRFVIAAYVVTWVVLLGYALRLARVRRKADDLLAEARADVSEFQT
jgi:CcmD family protein